MNKSVIIEFYSKYSAHFDKKIGKLVNYNESYTNFVAIAKRKTSLLDLACGPGNVAAFIKSIIPGIEITCVDLSPEMLDLAQKKIGKGNFYQTDILNLDIPVRKYDLICCAFGLPYIKRVEIDKFVREVSRFAEKETLVYISCMKGEAIEKEKMSFADNQTLLVQRYKKEEIIDNFQKYGFFLSSYNTLKYNEPDGNITTDMIFFFEKRN